MDSIKQKFQRSKDQSLTNKAVHHISKTPLKMQASSDSIAKYTEFRMQEFKKRRS